MNRHLWTDHVGDYVHCLGIDCTQVNIRIPIIVIIIIRHKYFEGRRYNIQDNRHIKSIIYSSYSVGWTLLCGFISLFVYS